MAIKNLPINFNVSFDVEDDIQDKIIYHLGSAFNYIRDLEESLTLQNTDENNAKSQLSNQLHKIADVMNEVLPGIVDETIEYEADELRDELRKLEIKKSALINKIIKLGSYTS